MELRVSASLRLVWVLGEFEIKTLPRLAGCDLPGILRSFPSPMNIHVQFFSWFKDLAGCAQVTETVPPGCTLDELHGRVLARFPKLAPAKKSTLLAVGVDYQPRDYVLEEGDEVSLFPPVQGG